MKKIISLFLVIASPGCYAWAHVGASVVINNQAGESFQGTVTKGLVDTLKKFNVDSNKESFHNLIETAVHGLLNTHTYYITLQNYNSGNLCQFKYQIVPSYFFGPYVHSVYLTPVLGSGINCTISNIQTPHDRSVKFQLNLSS